MLPQELHPEETEATATASQPQLGAGAAAHPQLGAGAGQQVGSGALQREALRAFSLANKPTRPPQVGAGAHAGAASQAGAVSQAGAGAGSQAGAGAGSQAGAGAGQPQLSLAAFAACNFASKPTRPPQDGAGADSGAQAAGAPQPDRACSFERRPSRPPQDAIENEPDIATAAMANDANRTLIILTSSRGNIELDPRNRHDVHPENMDHSRQNRF